MPAREEDLDRSEIEALLATRRELGPHYEVELVDGFADRIEQAVSRRVAQQQGDLAAERRDHSGHGQRQVALGIVSSILGVPITAISLAVPETGEAGLMALLVSWGGLVGINWAHARQGRR